MPDEKHPPAADEDTIGRALLNFDQLMKSGSVSGQAETTIRVSETDAVIQENIKTLRLLDAVRLTEKDPPASQNRIGRFEIIGELGRGGFGVVLLARDPRLNRFVALKVPRPEAIVTEDLRQRFFREAEAAAALNHPHILPIYEQGAAGPVCYIAMAYCEGPSLAQWMEKNGSLAPKIAARIVATLADALQHAHNRGVVHRDVKPANVLIDAEGNRQPGDGDSAASIGAASLPDAVWLTDFGMARLEDDQGQTKTGDILGTPLYMSPEQAAGRKENIGNSSDIYSLGATLYFLLTGKPPLKGETGVETLLAIQNEDPPAPSRHDKSIPADLDAVCLKCLEKNPALRYASATELGADLERFLDSVPVQAREITALVRAGRWCGRNPLLTAAAGVVLAITVGSLIWINHERNLATTSAKRSADVLRVVTDSFQSVNPFTGADAQMSARDVLLNAKENLEASQLDEQGKSTLLHTLTNCLMQLGDFESAISSAQQSFAIRTETLGPDAPETLSALINLAVAYGGAGRLEEAIPLYEQALAGHIENLGPNHPETLLCKTDVATAYFAVNRQEEAVSLYEQVFEARQASLGPDHLDTIMATNNLAAGYHVTGRIDEALQLFEAVAATRKERLGFDHPDTLISLNNLAVVYDSIGRLEDAIAIYEEVLPALEKKLGAEHPNTLSTLANLANALRLTGREIEALQIHEQVWSLRKAKHGADHPQTLESLHEVAHCTELTGQLEDAIPLYQDVLANREQKLGTQHPATLISMNYLAAAFKQAGRLSDAIACYEGAVDGCTATHGREHPETLTQMGGLGQTLIADGQPAVAESILRPCVELGNEHHPDLWKSALHVSLLGEALLAQDQFDDAAPLLLNGYQDLKTRADSIPAAKRPAQLRAALERLLKLAEATENDADAERWRVELESIEATD